MTLTIVSGGQTGADRAALNFALQNNIPHAGWCPRGRLAEDGRLADGYLLRETPTAQYAERTEWNVRDSDATVLFTVKTDLAGGTRLTAAYAAAQQKPLLHLAADKLGPLEAAVALRQFIAAHRVERLNIAGPRASQAPEVAAYVTAVLTAALGPGPSPQPTDS